MALAQAGESRAGEIESLNAVRYTITISAVAALRQIQASGYGEAVVLFPMKSERVVNYTLDVLYHSTFRSPLKMEPAKEAVLLSQTSGFPSKKNKYDSHHRSFPFRSVSATLLQDGSHVRPKFRVSEPSRQRTRAVQSCQ
jgi:hypothetical protein